MRSADMISIAILGLATLVGGATGRTIRVPAEANTIQAGIDLVNAGDTVLVAPGVYTGAGNWDLSFSGRDLVLRSEAGAEATILDGTGGEAVHARAMTFSSETRASVVDGFTVQDFTTGYTSSGILCEGSSAPTVLDCVFRRNATSGGFEVGDGTALTARAQAQPRVTGCRFAENGGWYSHAGTVAVQDAAQLELEDCEITQNLGPSASGLEIRDDAARARLLRCRIVANLGHGVGASGALEMTECLVAGNIASIGGGLSLRQGTLRRCTIASNDGGGLWVWDHDGDVLVEQTILHGNCEVQAESHGRLRLICCAADSTEVVAQPGGTVEWIGPQVYADPRLCAPASCEEWPSDGDYHIRSDSPCLPELSPCGQLIGALGVGCPGIPIGACCEGPVCRVTTWADCYTHGGIYVGGGSGCAPNPCVPIPVERTTWGQIKARFR